MRPDIEEILNSYKISTPELLNLKDLVLASCKELKAKEVIGELLTWFSDKEVPRFGRDAFLSVVLSIAYQEIKDFKKAEVQLENACMEYIGQDNDWNACLSLWLLGIVNISNHELEKARINLDDAKKKFSQHIRLHENEYDNRIIKLQKQLDSYIANALDEAITQPLKAIHNKINMEGSPNKKVGALVLSWLPVFQVQAGSNGPSWVIVPENDVRTEINEIILNDTPYQIFSVFSDRRQIRFLRNHIYGWALVDGYSMNQTKPTTIEPDDYVLFYSSNGVEEDNSLVITAKTDLNDGETYMLKRFNKLQKLLLSETSETGKEYEPIPIDESYRILGIVVAVAKPNREKYVN